MIYTSTCCIKNPTNIIDVLEEYRKSDIENVELGSVHTFFEPKLLAKYDFNFMIHGYFPPPKIPFNFNLASQNKIILKKSIDLAKAAIDVCCEINSSIFTFHAGIATDPPKLGVRLPRKNIVDKEIARKTFFENTHVILDYAKQRGIKLSMELNVVQKFNLDNGKNRMILFADYEDVQSFYKEFKKSEIGILLDLAHTNVTSYWLRFDRDKFVAKMKDKVSVIHISNNNGLQDQNLALTGGCWEVSKLKKFKNKPITLESMNLTINEIKQNLELIRNNI